jgi:ApaG protein
MHINTLATYLPEQSSEANHRYLWSYEITITNDSEEIIQLLNRRWKITELTGHIEEVHGPGVVGLQPIIKPARKFTYTSFCQLTTPQGTMEGHYEMQTLEEVHFIIQIPKIILLTPDTVSRAYREKLH